MTDVSLGRLPRRRVTVLGATDYGINLFWHSLELFMLFYYTEILGISPLLAALILTLGSLCDAVMDPIIGSAADRTRTRWGRFRPWVVVMAPIVAICLAAAFYRPALSGLPLVGYALVSHLVFRAAYTSAAIPFIALSARAVLDTRDRSLLSGTRMQFAGVASLTVAFAYPWMADRFGSGVGQQGYMYAAACLGLLAIPVMWATMAYTKEPVEPPVDPSVQVKKASAKEDLRAILSMVRHNRDLVRVLIAIVMLSTAGTLISKLTMFYYKYVAHAPELGRYALAVSAISMLLVAPIWAYASNRLSKRAAWMIASALAGIGLAALFFVPAGFGKPTLIIFFLIAVGTTGFSVLFWSMVPDTVDVNEKLFGDRYEAKTISVAMFARKFTLAINAILIGLVLEATGYVSGGVEHQGTADGVRGLIAFVPLFCVAVSVIAMWGYRLNATEHAKLRRENAARK